MNDTCLACDKPIFTVRLEGHGVTLAQRWTHGSRRKDKQHMPIPTNHEYEKRYL